MVGEVQGRTEACTEVRRYNIAADAHAGPAPSVTGKHAPSRFARKFHIV